jgi:NAD(P)-dependent dehydrogenase (short-subunit alcohol dehydrogenase family)
MNLELEGRTVLVTGGSRGLGRGLVEAFLREGARVRFCARSEDAVRQTEEDTAPLGDVAGAVVDVADAAAYRAWLDRCWDALNGVGVLVSNASAMTLDSTPESWDACYRVDLRHAVTGIDTLAPRMAESGGGAIVLVSSVSGLDLGQPPNVRAYATMKAALVSLGGHAAQEYARHGVRVNVVSPGSILSEGGFWDGLRSEAPDMFARFEAAHAMGRMASPAEIIDPILFLASARAGFVTGANLRVEGGAAKGPNF